MMMGVRILHTADWQIAKQFESLGAPPDKLAYLRQERLSVVRRIGDLAVSEKVGAILVAGDIFDRNDISDLPVRELLHILRAVEIPWLLLPGNHDPFTVESVWERMLRFGCPPHVHVLRTGDPVILCDGRLAVIPAPLTRRHQYEDPTELFATIETPEGAIRVGLAHGSVRNRLPEASEQYNMISDTRAIDARLDYLALGDWHGAAEIADRTWYSGTPEADSFLQSEAGHVLIVDLPSVGQAPKVTRVFTGHYRWYDLEATLQSPDARQDLDSVVSIIEEPRAAAVVQLTLRGAVSLSERARVADHISELEAEVQVLRANLDELIAAPSDADLDEIGRQGFIGTVVQRLRAVHADASNPDHRHAATALQRLYIEHVLGGRL
jgi:DNA repair exonuclease SbcCD nuclease subunit